MFVFFRTQFTVCIILHQSLALALTSNLCNLTKENICGNLAKKICFPPPKTLMWTKTWWLASKRCKAAEKCIHYHESQSRLPPACCYQWEYRTRLPRIGLRVLGSCNRAHITTTRQYQSQTDGCNSVGVLDTLANRALVKQLTRHLPLPPNSARRSEGSDHTSSSPWQLRSLSLLAWFSLLFPSVLLHEGLGDRCAVDGMTNISAALKGT